MGNLNADLALKKLLTMDFDTVLDVGCGNHEHTNIMRRAGKLVTTNDIKGKHDYVGMFLNSVPETEYDAIWCSHVLEHQENVGDFLFGCYLRLKDDGILAITVPPLKHNIVGGHLTLWNAGLLLYNLVLAGFDCSEASVKTYGYNISVILRKKLFDMPELNYDNGDIELLAPYFPMPVYQGFNGIIEEVNW